MVNTRNFFKLTEEYLINHYGYDLNFFNFDFETFFNNIFLDYRKYPSTKTIRIVIGLPSWKMICNLKSDVHENPKLEFILEIMQHAFEKSLRKNEKFVYHTHRSYKQYLHSKWWENRRLEALKLSGNKCQLCASKSNLHVHHNNYDNLGCEKSEDLIVLCNICHAKFHDKMVS